MFIYDNTVVINGSFPVPSIVPDIIQKFLSIMILLSNLMFHRDVVDLPGYWKIIFNLI